MNAPVDVDVLIVGAGISGLCAAHALMEACPDARFAIVEARDRIGGTWDLFRYPGIRSDSDMYTLGFSFRPWREPKAIADGPAILAYLEETARETGIIDHVRFGLRVEHAAWSSADARWTVRVRTGSGGAEQLVCRFLWVCAGYYRYDHGYTPEFPGIAEFAGRVVHPQQWPDDLDVAGKKVVIVGSGATAVTIAPVLAGQGAEVTLLQRTPTYMVSRPSRDRVAKALEAVLPARAAYRLVRSKNITLNAVFYRFCQRFPGPAKRMLLAGVRKELGGAEVSPDFDPPYGPWDQRLCLVPDSDLFAALRAGRLRVVTDRIDRFTERGLALTSGDTLDADVVITATGLELQFFGGAEVEVDGAAVDLRAARMYMGSMLSDVPNAAFVMGYTNASWTLKCELVCGYVARVLRHMRDHGYTRATPRRNDPSIVDRPAIEMRSGYFQRAIGRLPTQGSADPWRLHQDFFRDRRLYRRKVIDDGVLELR